MRRMYSKNQLEEQSIELLGSGKVPSIKGDEIIENMEGYGFIKAESFPSNITLVYVGAVKNGNKLTLVLAGKITGKTTSANPTIGFFSIPSSIGAKLVPDPDLSSALDIKVVQYFSSVISSPIEKMGYIYKNADTTLGLQLFATNSSFADDSTYYFRYECTLLLSENLAPQE